MLQTQHKGALYRPWIIWCTIVAFYFYQFLLRVSPSVITNDLMSELGIQACALGELVSYYYIGYTVMQIPVGVLIDRVGVRRPVIFALILCIAGCYLFAHNTSYAMLAFARLLMGIGSAFAFLCCVKSASVCFRPAMLGLLVGFTLMVGTIGGAIGGPGISLMLRWMDWRSIFDGLIAIGILLTVCAWIFVTDFDDVRGDHSNAQAPTTTNLLSELKAILTKSQTYVMGLYGAAMFIPLSAFADMWGVPYLVKAYHMDLSAAASVVSVMYLGVGLGSPLTAFVSDKTRSHKKVMLFGALLAAVLMFVCLYATLNTAMLYIVYFALGVCLGAQFLAYASVCQLHPLAISGTVSAVQNMFAMVSGIVFQPLIGKILDMVWSGSTVCLLPDYTSQQYLCALSLIPISLVVASVLSMMMQETYPQENYPKDL